MKYFALVTFIFATFCVTAQIPQDAWLFGTWIKQGFSFDGSFYPVLPWNKESFTLKEDYAMQKNNQLLVGSEVVENTSIGKWSYDLDRQKLRFYSDNEIITAKSKILLFDQEINVDFHSKNYFTAKEKMGDATVFVRYQREGTTESFEESETKENAITAQKSLNYDPDAAYYFQVNSVNLAKRKQLYFDKIIMDFTTSVFPKSDSIESINSYFSGTIADFTDSTISIKMFNESKEIYYQNGLESRVENDFGFTGKGYVLREYNLYDLDEVYLPRKLGSIGILTFSVSALTTLIIAPLISINYKNGDFNKNRYYKTAGIGLIGMGASIPIAYFLGNRKPTHFISLADPVEKNSWYLQKAPR